MGMVFHLNPDLFLQSIEAVSSFSVKMPAMAMIRACEPLKGLSKNNRRWFLMMTDREIMKKNMEVF